MLSKKDLGSSFAQGRERVVSWDQVQKKFVLAISTAAVQEIETKSQTYVVLLHLHLRIFGMSSFCSRYISSALLSTVAQAIADVCDVICNGTNRTCDSLGNGGLG